ADWKAILIRAGKEFMADNAMMLASALAYSTFFAIPAVLIVATGLFTLIASPQDITNFMHHVTFIPADAKSLLESSLTRASYNKTWGSLAAVIVRLTWLWITGMALLLGAEINAETERSRELRAS